MLFNKIYKLLTISVLLICSFGISSAQTINLEKDFNSLLSVERAFALTSKMLGTRSAFLRFLKNDAIVFNPEPVLGIELWEARPDSESLLSWEPVYSEISSSGNFGFTTGPWEYRSNKNNIDADAYGHYVTVWEKNEKGLWQAAIDAGISYPTADTSIVVQLDFIPSTASTSKSPKSSVDSLLAKLLQIDSNFSHESKTFGFKNAFTIIASKDVRLYRDGSFPIIGIEESLIFLDDSIMEWNPIDGGVSSNADLGFTYGTGFYDNSKFSYFRIWKKCDNNMWCLLLDVLL